MTNGNISTGANPHTRLRRCLYFMLVQALAFAVMSNMIRYLADYPPMETVFLRNVTSLLCLLPFMLLRPRGAGKGRHAHWGTRRIGMHVLRGTLAFASMTCWFVSLLHMPIPEAVALTYTTPLWMTLLALLFLREKLYARRMLAIIAGIVGVLVVIRPGFQGLGMVAALPLISSLLAAGAIFLIRPLSRDDSPLTVTWMMSLVMLPLSMPLGLAGWHMPDAWGWFCMAVVGVSSTLVQYMLARLYAEGEMTQLLPFDFIRLVFTVAIAWYAFDAALDVWSFVGAGIILASTILLAHREARAVRRAQAAAGQTL